MSDDPDNVVNSKYYSVNEIQSLKVANKNKSLSMLHINACSSDKIFDDLEYLLKCTNKKLDGVTVTETRTTRNTSKLCKIMSWMSSERLMYVQFTSCVYWVLYIANHLFYKPRNDLNIYKKSELESTFVEIINPKKSNIIVGVIYRHPSMDVTDFNQNYLNGLLDKILKKEKNIFRRFQH